MYPFYIAELIYPGRFIKYPSNNTLRTARNVNITIIFTSLEEALNEAAVSLTFFEQTRHFRRPRRINEPDYETRWNERLLQIVREKEQNSTTDNLIKHKDSMQIREQAETQLRQEQWKSGRMPESYERQFSSMYAKTFLYALERIKKLFDALLAELKNPIEEPDILKTVQTVRRDFGKAFPNLVGVRDTIAHYEQRIRRIEKNGKPLNLKTVSNQAINAPNGALILDTLIGNRYGGTMSNGEYGDVEISEQSLIAAQNFIQTTIDAFKWQGEKHFSLQ